MSLKLKLCDEPVDLVEEENPSVVLVRGHKFVGWHDKMGNYYEHDIDAGKWYMLDVEND